MPERSHYKSLMRNISSLQSGTSYIGPCNFSLYQSSVSQRFDWLLFQGAMDQILMLFQNACVKICSSNVMVFGNGFCGRQLGLHKVMKDPHDEISALKRRKGDGISLCFLPCEDTRSRWLSTNLRKAFTKNLTMLVPWAQKLSLQNYEKPIFIVEAPQSMVFCSCSLN